MGARSLLSGLGALLAVLLFGALNIIGNTLVTSWRLDLSANQLFTLSKNTRALIDELPEGNPIELRFYVSRELITGIPALTAYAARVQDVLREYQDRSDGRLRLTVIEPEPFSEEEDEAVRDGLRGVQVGGGGSLAYLGLSGINSTDDRAVLPFLSPSRESSLEYEIGKLIYKLSDPKRITVGIFTALPMFPAPGQRTRQQPWTIIRHLRELMDVRELDVSLTRIDPEVIDVLMVVHPKDMPERLIYAIDQYVLSGGKLLLLVDPLAEAGGTENPGGAGYVPDFGSNLPRLLKAWGLELAPEKVVGDLKFAMRVQVSGPRGQRESPYPPWLRLDRGQEPEQEQPDPSSESKAADDFVFNARDFTLSGINLLQLGTAGALLRKEQIEGLEFTPLVQSSRQADLLERDLILLNRDPAVLLQNLKAAGERYVLAGRLGGKAGSAFPDGPPDEDPEDTAAAAAQPQPDAGGADSPAHLPEGIVNVILVADTDLLRDLFWYREQSLGTLRLNQEISDNANFVIKALDHLSGSNALLRLTPRRVYPRTFSRVEAIRRAAEQQYRDREQQLQQSLEETEQKLRDLQSRPGEERSGSILSEAQVREINQFKREQFETRKQLRAVQHELRKNIERLGARLKLLNIGLFPLAVLLLALLTGYLRTRSQAPRVRKSSE